MRALRKLLRSIVSSKNGKNWYKPDLFMKNTLPVLPKRIKVLEFPPEKNKNYNCFIYVLGLQNESKILRQTHGFIYNSFFEKIIKEKELIKIERPRSGDVILYRNTAGLITHAGIVTDNSFITSKWSWGPVLKHRVFDVPDFYSSKISYYQRVGLKKALKLYAKYKRFNTKASS